MPEMTGCQRPHFGGWQLIPVGLSPTYNSGYSHVHMLLWVPPESKFGPQDPEKIHYMDPFCTLYGSVQSRESWTQFFTR